MREEVVRRSGELFDPGYGRAEGTPLAVCEERGNRSEPAPRIAAGSCGGMARSRGVRGAVSVAITLVLGILGLAMCVPSILVLTYVW